MEKYLETIDGQLAFNQGKNIFKDSADSPLKFANETIRAIAEIKDLSIESENLLINYTADKAIEEFYRINQYYSFNGVAKLALQKIYRELFLAIRSGKHSLDDVSKSHHKKIKAWLQQTNAFSEKMYADKVEKIEPVPCAEYSPELQISLLKIKEATADQLILDIGCGKQANLVQYLSQRGMKAFGIDRFPFSEEHLVHADWLEYDYGTAKWGTIISHLGFTNHFKHHHLREDGNFIEYAQKYMEILKSLKIGGSFHYAPDLPFIETYLDRHQYKVDAFDISALDFKAIVITRLK